MFNEENGEWEEVSGSGGGGGSGGVIIATVGEDYYIQYSFNELWAFVNNGYLVYLENPSDADIARTALTNLAHSEGEDYYAVFANTTLNAGDPDEPMYWND